MFNTALVTAQLRKVVGWKNFWDLAEIPALGATLNTSESGQYYQDFHPALRLDYISSLRPPSDTLTNYLTTVVTESIPQLLNRVETQKQLQNVGRDIATSDVVFDIGKKQANITNTSYFCGVSFALKSSVGLAAIINRVGLYLTAAVTDLDLYLFHSSQEDPIDTYQFTTTKVNSFSWLEQRIEMFYEDGNVSGGTWFLGYYQDDLASQASQAVSYTNTNWMLGYCTTCNGGQYQEKYLSISNHLALCGFYQPAAVVGTFDSELAVKTNTNNWGFNFNITIGCDMTQFWIDNRRVLANVLGMQVAMSVLQMMKFSSEINNVEEGIKIMIVRDLEGANDTGQKPLWSMLNDSVNALILDNGNLNTICLPCARKPKTSYGALG